MPGTAKGTPSEGPRPGTGETLGVRPLEEERALEEEARKAGAARSPGVEPGEVALLSRRLRREGRAVPPAGIPPVRPEETRGEECSRVLFTGYLIRARCLSPEQINRLSRNKHSLFQFE